MPQRAIARLFGSSLWRLDGTFLEGKGRIPAMEKG